MKHTVGIKKTEKTNKDLYRVLHDLEKYKRSSFSFSDPKRQAGLARTISVKFSNLDKSLYYPPASHHNGKLTLVQLPIGVNVKKEKTKKGIRFRFYREK